jgi:hypothetical protein
MVAQLRGVEFETDFPDGKALHPQGHVAEKRAFLALFDVMEWVGITSFEGYQRALLENGKGLFKGLK